MNIVYEIKFKISSLSFLFILLVIIIGTATNFYILNYFKQEERAEEFILLLNWFIFSMIFLLLSNNFFTIIIGWELIGITSFLLINFWKLKSTTLSCSFKAFCFNKISDIFLMIGFCILTSYYKTSNVDTLLTLLNFNYNNINNVYSAMVCILISSCIKSAQFLGHLWLPDSMEAPVPASALIHSATLVSAGIYLLLKFQPLFIHTNLMETIFFIGSFTACYGGVVAASQTDMKKLLAYSTISHCGFIVASVALNNFIVTITYLYLHGLFKASTFFCAGSIIKYNNTQDTRKMGMNKNQLFSIVTLTISSFNLGGLPFTFGYLYKSLFLTYLIINPINLICYGFCIVGLLSSIVYVFKLIYYSCFDIQKGHFNHVIYLLQNSHFSFKNQYQSYTWFKALGFSILYLFSIFFYVFIKYFMLKNYLFFYHCNNIQINDYIFLNKLILTKLHLVKIYYTLFTCVLLSFLLSNNRSNYFFTETLNLYVVMFGIFIFFKLTTKPIQMTFISLNYFIGFSL